MLGALRNIVQRVRQRLELREHTPYTKAEYFRKQGAKIGEGCFIVPAILGAEPYLVRIGNHVAIAKGVSFVTHDGATWIFRDEMPDVQAFGPIVIEDNCLIGLNAVIFPNVRIGPNSIVGANSVVISDVPANTMVIGVPARPLGSVIKYKEKCAAQWAVQRPSDCVIEPGETWWTSAHFDSNRQKLKVHLMELFADRLNP